MRTAANFIATTGLTGGILYIPYTTGVIQGLWIAAFTLSLVYVGSLTQRLMARVADRKTRQ